MSSTNNPTDRDQWEGFGSDEEVTMKWNQAKRVQFVRSICQKYTIIHFRPLLVFIVRH